MRNNKAEFKIYLMSAAATLCSKVSARTSNESRFIEHKFGWWPLTSKFRIAGCSMVVHIEFVSQSVGWWGKFDESENFIHKLACSSTFDATAWRSPMEISNPIKQLDLKCKSFDFQNCLRRQNNVGLNFAVCSCSSLQTADAYENSCRIPERS